jgi:hypothetical protein
VLKSSLAVSPISGPLVSRVQDGSASVTEDVYLQQFDLHGKPQFKLLLHGPTLRDGIAARIQLEAQYEPSSAPQSRTQCTSTYLDQLWIGKKFDRDSLVSTLSSCGWACTDSDLSCLRDKDACLTEEVLNSFLCIVSAHRPECGCFSTFFYEKLHGILHLPDEADRQSELDRLCRWMRPEGGTRNLKKEYFVPIYIAPADAAARSTSKPDPDCLAGQQTGDCQAGQQTSWPTDELASREAGHFTFVHVDLKISSNPEKLLQGKTPKRQAIIPTLTYYDSFHGNLQSCLDNLEVFFKHLAVLKDYPELQLECSWEKNRGEGPTQYDDFNCALFVCAGIDCLSSGISPMGYATSTMSAFKYELLQLFTEAGLGIQSNDQSVHKKRKAPDSENNGPGASCAVEEQQVQHKLDLSKSTQSSPEPETPILSRKKLCRRVVDSDSEECESCSKASLWLPSKSDAVKRGKPELKSGGENQTPWICRPMMPVFQIHLVSHSNQD